MNIVDFEEVEGEGEGISIEGVRAAGVVSLLVIVEVVEVVVAFEPEKAVVDMVVLVIAEPLTPSFSKAVFVFGVGLGGKLVGSSLALPSSLGPRAFLPQVEASCTLDHSR